MRREIATKWQCQRSGDCCLEPQLVATWAEVQAMRDARPEVNIPAVTHGTNPRFAILLTPGGCPFLSRELTGEATCSIYESRPYVCRRFQCLRPDAKTEPYKIGGPMGCRNLSDRIEQSTHALKFYESNQRRAQKTWANSHGWQS